MSTPSAAVSGSVAPPLTGRSRDHRFFTGMAALLLLCALAGFAPSYYLRGFTDAPPLPGLVHLHGALATTWLVLFLAQTSLVFVGRTDVHRRLGVAAACVGVLFIAVGWFTAIERARQGDVPGRLSAVQVLAFGIAALLSFALLAGFGFAARRRRETHRRLMLLATIAMMAPAFARMRWLGTGGPPVASVGTTLLVLGCMYWDWRAHGRIHPAFLWGGGLLLVSLPLRFAVARSDAWVAVARWLTG